MYSHCFELEVAASPEDVWQFHKSASALQELTPRNVRVRLIGSNVAVEDNALHKFRMPGKCPKCKMAMTKKMMKMMG